MIASLSADTFHSVGTHFFWIDEKDLRADYVVPDAFDPRVAPAVAAAVARVAMETGIARIKVDPEEVRANTMKRVGR